MGVVQLPDELQRVIERQVAEGRAASSSAFLEEAVLRLVDDACAEENDVGQAAEAGMADAAAGRYTTVATQEDEQILHERLMARLRTRLAADEQLVYRLTRTAEDQIDAVLLESARTYGIEGAGRYGQRIRTVMAALGDEPERVGFVEVRRLPGIRAYPLRLSRLRVEPGRRVATPRHLVIYRLASEGVVEILGLVHDRLVLSHATPKIIRASARR